MNRTIVSTFALFITVSAFAQPDATATAQAVPFPHPSITEVNFHVLLDSESDASLDGVRDAVGDEFIEIANLHDRKIDIAGYTLTDRDASITFTFPKLSLEPGEVAVLFNGYNTTIVGPVGGSTSAPASRNAHFNNAWIFNLGNTKRTTALNNQGDRVTLSAPDGLPVDIVMWGPSETIDYVSHPRIASVRPSPKCSVQRIRETGELLRHVEIDGTLFSPGRVPDRVTVSKAEED